MSRSYKKNPISQDGRSRRKWIRNLANRRVRRKHNWDKVSSRPGSYKRLYEQWSICDYFSMETLDEAIRRWQEHVEWREMKGYNPDPKDTLERAIKRWKKFHYWK